MVAERDYFDVAQGKHNAAESKLSLALDQYVSLYDLAPLGLATLNKQGIILQINLTGRQLLGGRQTPLNRWPLVTFIHKQDRKKIHDHLRSVRLHSTPLTTTVRLHRQNGNDVLWVEICSAVWRMKDPSGETLTCTLTDVSARKRAEEALQESEGRFTTLADAAPVLIWITGPDRRFTYFNRPWLEFTGRRLEQEVDNGWVAGVHPEDVQHFEKAFQAAFQRRRPFTWELRLRRHDRDYRWVFIRGIPRFRPGREFMGFIGSGVDITERKEMESALALAGRLPKENPFPVIRLAEGRFVNFANPAARDTLGAWKTAIGREVPPRIVQIAAKALATNAKSKHELGIGSRRFEVSFVPVPSARYVNLYFSDITERKRAIRALRRAHTDLEERVRQRTRELTRANLELRKEIAARRAMEQTLQEDQERFSLMIQGARDHAFFMLDPRGRVKTWNSGAEKIKGYRATQILGRHFSRFYTREDVRNGKPAWLLEIARSTGRAEDEGWRVRRNGSRFWAHVSISPLYDNSGELRGYLKVTRDITERRQAQEVLQKSRESLENFFEHSPLAMFWINSRGRIQRINQAGLQLLGCWSEECVDHLFIEFWTDKKLAQQAISQLAKGQVLLNFRATLRAKSGGTRDVLIDANSWRERGRLLHTRWFVRDISRRIELEREILDIAERERQRIGQDLHDDLCQQLAGIEFMSQTLASRLANGEPNLTNNARDIAGMIRDAITHTRNLSHGLTPVHLEAGGLPTSLRELARQTRRVYQINCQFRMKRMTLNLDEAWSIQLYRIAQEAVANAIRHGKTKRINIGLEEDDNQLVLTVRDFGIGLPPRMPQRKGIGIKMMQHRAGVIGGKLLVTRNPRGGTTVLCTVGERQIGNQKDKANEGGKKRTLRQR